MHVKKRLARSLVAAITVTLFLLPAALLASDELTPEAKQMNQWFHEASEEFDVPVELLQGIAFTESRWRHIIPENEMLHEDDEVTGDETEARIGPMRHGKNSPGRPQPAAYGVMGLRSDDHFGHSLRIAASLIGLSEEELKADPRQNIRGAAALLSAYGEGKTRTTPIEHWEDAVARYSGIPQPRVAEMHTYDILSSIISGRASDRFRVRQKEIDLVQVYGQRTLEILRAPRLTVDVRSAAPEGGEVGASSIDYGPALYDAAATCNYGAGRSEAVTHVAEHIAQGSYAGTISWFKNCSASVSAHYVVRSSDGQITQMVREHDTAWHVASHNSYTVGIEHEGYAADCAWYTTAMYNASSLLTRDIADSHGIPRDGTYDASLGWDTELARTSKWKIKGHTNFPTTKTCPGSCFDWPRFRSLVIGTAWSQIVDNASTRFSASANWATSSYSTQRYSTDYRYANPQAVSDAAWFKFNLPATANYEVQVWYPANSGYNSATPFVLATSAGNVTKNVNQQVNGGVWVSLGTYQFNGGDYNAVGVSRWTSSAGYVIADAVKMIRK
jgi:N-acetyl-anhydromuramyl-L-alanine amidase AmpD